MKIWIPAYAGIAALTIVFVGVMVRIGQIFSFALGGKGFVEQAHDERALLMAIAFLCFTPLLQHLNATENRVSN